MNAVIMELPQTWNKYSYVYNRPTYSTDPDGHCPLVLERLLVASLKAASQTTSDARISA